MGGKVMAYMCKLGFGECDACGYCCAEDEEEEEYEEDEEEED
jgi:hypothetical protein